MPKADQAPAPIEGSKLLVEGQDIKPLGRPQQLADSSGIVFPLTVHKRGKSTIVEENIPKKPIFSKYSLLEKGSEISGPVLWGFSSCPLNKGSIVVGGSGRTSSHPGQSATIKGICLMMTVSTWSGYTLEVHPKEILLK